VPEKIKFVATSPAPGEVPVPRPEQLTALLTVMVRVAMLVVPALKRAKFPLVKGTVEAVKAELLAQFAVLVSHVPLFAAVTPLLSQ
jgi:hypothetical protein